MATIWKFAVPIADEFELTMPRDAELLHVHVQRGIACLWARVVPERHPETRHFAVRGTGHSVDLDCKYVDTFMLAGDDLVFHLFERSPA